MPTRIALTAGRTGPLRVASDLFDGRFQIVDQQTRRPVSHQRAGREITIDVRAGRTYVATSAVSVSVHAPDQVVADTAFPARVTVTSRGAEVPAAALSMAVPSGWTVSPSTHAVPTIPSGQSRTYTFDVTPTGSAEERQGIEAVLSGADWRTSGVTQVRIEPLPPCAVPSPDTPLVAWNPSAGGTVADVSPFGRDATVDGAAAYDSAAPSGTGLTLPGQTFLRTSATSLGFLKEATFAAEVKVDGSGSYRRLFDFQPGGDPGTDGVLIDLTPSNQVRFIGSNQNVTTDAVVPTGRYVDLVVTWRTAASAVDRAAILADALTAEEVRRWRTMAFG